MDRRARFRLELRAVVVSFKAALRSFDIDGTGRVGDDEQRAVNAQRRALDLLDGVAERFDDITEDADGRSALEGARRTVRARDLTIVTEDEVRT
jgi:hypothetical protein